MERLASSYRDPAGFMFLHNKQFYRFVHPRHFENYSFFISSGLYKALTDAKRLIAHEEVTDSLENYPSTDPGKILLPEQLPFISYPYEWSFNMWRDAALLTVRIAMEALNFDMVLKDASPFNVQFFGGRPVFIDTLSFEKYLPGNAWVAYRQFCECFLGPLLLMHYLHRDAAKLFLSSPDGIPLDMLKQMLPRKSKWNLHVYLHIWMQQKISSGGKNEKHNRSAFTKEKMQRILKGLEMLLCKLKPKAGPSAWSNYYTETITGGKYLDAKAALVKSFAAAVSFGRLIDLGANDGFFSLLLKDRAETIIATDADSVCVNEIYRQVRKDKIQNIIPIVSAFNNPSPAIGVRNEERDSLLKRLKGDLVLALALVHHLAISHNLSFEDIAAQLRNMAPLLIIEFIPREDEKVKLLLKNRTDIFPQYSPENFKKAFTAKYEILKEEKIGLTDRILFLMRAVQ